jgi:hypothetical protein
MLCSLCSVLDWHQILQSKSDHDHHKTYADLSLAASQECDFCILAHNALLDTLSREFSLPVVDVVQLQLEQEELASQWHGDPRSRFKLQLDSHNFA